MATDLTVAADPGVGIALGGVPWGVYEDLRANPENDHLRMTYLDGVLYLMSPEYRHEHVGHLLARVILSVTMGLGLEIIGIGSTTLRRGRRKRNAKGRATGMPRMKNLGSAKEADVAFYLGANELKLRDREEETLDLTVDPPPDLAIEVDNKADSEVALPVYARLGVPEVWRYNAVDPDVWFGRLEGRHYLPIERSVCLPMLTPALVLEALNARRGRGLGENAWARWVEEWARGLPTPPSGEGP